MVRDKCKSVPDKSKCVAEHGSGHMKIVPDKYKFVLDTWKWFRTNGNVCLTSENLFRTSESGSGHLKIVPAKCK